MEIFLGKQITAVPLGKLLLEQGVLTQPELERALIIQKKSGGRLGQILISEQLIAPMTLAETVARHHGKECVNLIKNPCDPQLLQNRDLTEYVQLEVLPIARKNGRVQVAATDISFGVIEWSFKKYGNAFDIVITSPRDILWSIEREFGKVIDIESRYLLSSQFPERSTYVALTGFPRLFSWSLVAGLMLLAMVLGARTIPLLFLLVNIIYALTLLFKAMLFLVGRKKQIWTAGNTLPVMRDHDLPIYTVLVPLYKEKESLPHLLESLRALDYPKAKLDVKLIIEADDEETIEAAKLLKPDYMIEFIRVPYSLPRTKPKACNYALRFARGEYVTIYDAEDQPDPMQLKKSVHAFRNMPPEVVCLQARLNYYNRDDNWLTKFFSLEYANWFDFLLPGLESLDIPIPLGGTSNHISLTRLRELGQWDPYNVTEDADLGVRIALSGERTRVLQSLTLEEAPSTLKGWMAQRTRWIKGYIQTWLVHMRHPGEMVKGFGWRGLFGFHLFIGGPCFVFLSTPIMLLISALYFAGHLTMGTPHLIALLAWSNMVLGYAIHIWFAWVIVRVRGWKAMMPYALFFPFYWFLHSYASYKAVYQLITNPYYWEKTTHGKSQSLRNSQLAAMEFN